jgi:hypothetical protein
MNALSSCDKCMTCTSIRIIWHRCGAHICQHCALKVEVKEQLCVMCEDELSGGVR